MWKTALTGAKSISATFRILKLMKIYWSKYDWLWKPFWFNGIHSGLGSEAISWDPFSLTQKQQGLGIVMCGPCDHMVSYTDPPLFCHLAISISSSSLWLEMFQEDHINPFIFVFLEKRLVHSARSCEEQHSRSPWRNVDSHREQQIKPERE